MALLSVIVLVCAMVIAYSMIERRINHRTCPGCGFRVSNDAPGDACPRCNPVFDQEWQELERDDPFSSQTVTKRLLDDWPRIVFAGVPLAIIIVVGGLLVAERFQSDADKAIQLVKESNSRKENFSVQQYLYATVYHRRDQGEPITIEGWSAEPSQSSSPIKVEFVYTDADGQHAAMWEASIREKTVTPRNETASNISWR
ncbi:MAG: hypothetical protein WAU45_06780 [Blastocatellia bacterium]